jgi:hypothetical protein
VTNELLLERGIKYDHSLMHNDHQPYYVRVGDRWTKIDYAKKPREWMVPLQRGQETDLIEIPASWYLDDLPPMMFIKKSPNSHGFVNPRDIEEMWRDQFDWAYRLRGVSDDHPPRRFGPAARADDAGAALPSHDRPFRRAFRHHERDGRRLRQALPAQEGVGTSHVRLVRDAEQRRRLERGDVRTTHRGCPLSRVKRSLG